MTGWLPRHRRAPCRVAFILVTVLAGSVLLAPVVEADQPDYDCTDFDTQAIAQDFYEKNGGPLYDPFNLDDDADGVACEDWERDYEQTRSGENGSAGLDGVNMDCADFATQREAQRYFEEDGGAMDDNVDHLDANHNGLACEPGEPG